MLYAIALTLALSPVVRMVDVAAVGVSKGKYIKRSYASLDYVRECSW